MEACKDGCKYFIRLSDEVWTYLTENNILNFAGADRDGPKLNYCAANNKFIKSAIFACTVKHHGMQEKEFKGLKDKLGEK